MKVFATIAKVPPKLAQMNEVYRSGRLIQEQSNKEVNTQNKLALKHFRQQRGNRNN